MILISKSSKVSESDIRAAKRLGKGNYSAGVRLALRFANKELKPPRVK